MPRSRAFLPGPAIVVIAALLAFLLLRRAPRDPLPPTTLVRVGLTSLPPLGTLTAFRLSNAGPTRLLYAPRLVEFSGATGVVRVRHDRIVDCVALIAPSNSHVFMVPGAITNGSLKVHLEARGKAAPGSLGGGIEALVRRLSPAGDAFCGPSYRAVLEETP